VGSTSKTAEVRLGILVWVIVLGGAGFAAGFLGPIALNPEANQGPLVGIFVSGPLGALAGLVLGTIFRIVPVTDRLRLYALVSICSVLAVGTLYYCLPEPKVRGYVIEAEVEGCDAPGRAFAAALAEWEKAVAYATWATPPADWKDTARRNVDRDPGRVLTMRIVRRSTIHEHRKPWNAGLLTASAWAASDEAERYYVRDAGRDCAAYRARGRDLYTPYTERSADRIEPAAIWPPTDAIGFLGLMELGEVPSEYRRLIL
jgi:hypothetical protein